MIGLHWSFYLGVVPLTAIVGALALLWAFRSDAIKLLVRCGQCPSSPLPAQLPAPRFLPLVATFTP